MKIDPGPQYQNNIFFRRQVILRVVGLYLLFTLLSLALGIAFFLITISFIPIVLWFAFYWDPATKVLHKALNIPSDNRNLIKIPLTWWRVFTLGLKGSIIIFGLYMGCRILLTQGFLSQNIIYLIFKN
jgi:hypothetical protein